MTTVCSSEREVSLEKAFFPTLFEHTIKVDETVISGRRVGHSHYPDLVPVLCTFLNISSLGLQESEKRRGADI